MSIAAHLPQVRLRLWRAQNALLAAPGSDDATKEALEIVCGCWHAIWQSADAATMPGLLKAAQGALLRFASEVPGRDAAVEELQEALEFLTGEDGV